MYEPCLADSISASNNIVLAMVEVSVPFHMRWAGALKGARRAWLDRTSPRRRRRRRRLHWPSERASELHELASTAQLPLPTPTTTTNCANPPHTLPSNENTWTTPTTHHITIPPSRPHVHQNEAHTSNGSRPDPAARLTSLDRAHRIPTSGAPDIRSAGNEQRLKERRA